MGHWSVLENQSAQERCEGIKAQLSAASYEKKLFWQLSIGRHTVLETANGWLVALKEHDYPFFMNDEEIRHIV